jgi:hypothetical protein
MIQFAKHHAMWNIIGLAIIVLVTAFFVKKLIHDARQQPVAVKVVFVK